MPSIGGRFEFIFDYLDSTQVRNALPILFGEYVADERWQTKPRQKQTSIIASQLSGDFGSGGDRATPELNSRFPEINLYENQILMLDRAFTSPLHDRASSSLPVLHTRHIGLERTCDDALGFSAQKKRGDDI